MTEFYEGENSCVRCLRSSPIASLLGFIIVLLGGGAFGGAVIFARRYLITLLDAPNLFPYLDYAIYGLVGALGLFSLLAYLLCALSSGWNAKHCFESSRKATCGRCCNMSLIICLVFGILLWTAIACLISYPVISIALLIYRNDGPTRLRMTALERSTAALRNPTGFGGTMHYMQPHPAYYNHPDSGMTRQKRLVVPLQEDAMNTPYLGQMSPNLDVQNFSEADQEFADPNQIDSIPEEEDSNGGEFAVDAVTTTAAATPLIKTESADHLSKTKELADLTSNINNAGQMINQPGPRMPNLNLPVREALSVAESFKQFFKCSPDLFDLSYYGLYDQDGLPIFIARANFVERIRDILICVAFAVAGIFLLLLGYIQIVICTAMNYARMQEARYYEASDAGEEGVALQQ